MLVTLVLLCFSLTFLGGLLMLLVLFDVVFLVLGWLVLLMLICDL